MTFTLRCRCRWDGAQCPNQATEEDGFCDWCGPVGTRPAMGGGGQRHINTSRSPDACWMPNSGRTLAPIPPAFGGRGTVGLPVDVSGPGAADTAPTRDHHPLQEGDSVPQNTTPASMRQPGPAERSKDA